MAAKQPPFEITNSMIDRVSEVSRLLGRLDSTQRLSTSPTLRRGNRIRTIQGSLAIEQNTLSLEQVTAVLDGKHVIAPPKDVAEVKNAFEIYDRLDELDPYSIDSLLLAHGVMMRGLLADAGCFRTRPAGVADRQGNILHFGTLPPYVPGLIQELMDWARATDVHPLLKSCVFHYEFELIHPFLDGNGRIGRLWHTLILSRWNPLFAWLPVESIIHDRQAEYYEAINASNLAVSSNVFILFMLAAIRDALSEAVATESDAAFLSDRDADRWERILEHLQTHKTIMNADVRTLLGVSSATANRILSGYTEKGLLVKCRVGGHWGYKRS